jgi:hypothetical protein
VSEWLSASVAVELVTPATLVMPVTRVVLLGQFVPFAADPQEIAAEFAQTSNTSVPNKSPRRCGRDTKTI